MTKKGESYISQNKKAFHDYTLTERFEAGIVLEGWEVKSIREGRVQLKDSYVVIRKQEAFLINCHISPLKTVSTHITPDPLRARKLLLSHKELKKLIGAVERKGNTLVPVKMYWKKNRYVKVEVALAVGKKKHDKRASEKAREWERDKARLLRKK